MTVDIIASGGVVAVPRGAEELVEHLLLGGREHAISNRAIGSNRSEHLNAARTHHGLPYLRWRGTGLALGRFGS